MIPVRAQLSSGLNSRFTQPDMSFAEYINNVRLIVQRARLDLNSDNREKILAANIPFELRPDNYDGQNAVLLVHGLFDSPSSMRDIGNFFYRQGFLVRAILLPGHSTVPGDLLSIDYHEWIKASQFGIDSLRSEAKKVFYAGFSTGASLGIYHALSREPLAGLFLLAPACRLNSLISFADQVFGFTRWLTQKDKWIVQDTTDDYAKYRSYPMKSATEVNALIARNHALASQQKIDIPIAMVLSGDDETIDSKAALNFLMAQPNPRNKLIYYTNSVIKIDDPRIEVLPSRYPAEHILDFSHICLPIAPDNPHYGKNGDYQEVLFSKGKTDKTIYQSALKPKYLKQYNFRRLSYNPDFDNMMALVQKFLL